METFKLSSGLILVTEASKEKVEEYIRVLKVINAEDYNVITLTDALIANGFRTTWSNLDDTTREINF